MSELNIYQRINKVREAVEYLKKDAKVENYMAVTHDAVTALVRDSMIKQGVIIVPSLKTSESIQGQTKSGTPKTIYRAQYEVKFVNMDKPEDFIPMIVEAHADDFSDKAPGKALSYAVKSGILKLFMIETGVNDESRLEEERKAQKKVLEQIKTDIEDMLEQGDMLGPYIQIKLIDQETQMEIFNLAPEGKKTAWKKQLRDIEEVGAKIIVALNEGIAADDDLAVKENMEGVTDRGKQLMRQYFPRDVQMKISELVHRGE